MKFRKDINGLRAIAVIAVVLFHFNESWLPGGFAGVDVFFVISGFLMTSIIFNGIERKQFSTIQFYIARANRILPALAVLSIALLLFGWFFITPSDYTTLTKHVTSSLFFLSNVTYWSESGYFDIASHNKWLLHSWSLSVEWQFYIIYPLILVTMRKFMSLKSMKLTLLISTIVLFLFSIIATYLWPNPAYYLLPTRAWEMMLGGIAYTSPFTIKDRHKSYVQLTGLTLIIGAYLFISKDTPWPGYLAILPVLGAFLVIQSQHSTSVITNNFIFQKLGAWSYSIYLWHWPFVVAIYYFSLEYFYVYLGILLSILFGSISYNLIEKRKFKQELGSWSILKSKPILITLVVVCFSLIKFVTSS